MDNVEKKTVSGSFYKDKNNNLYQIICEAYDVENKERKVIYQALFGDFAIYSLDRKIFTDKSEEVYGFERVEKGDNSFTDAKAKTEYDPDKSGVGKEDVTSSKQYNISNVLELSDNKDSISQSDLDSMYAVLEIASFEGETKYQIEKLIRYLGMQEHYEGSRLRR